MPGSILVARVLGIDIRIHLSWFLIFGLILLTFADRVLPSLRPYWSDQKTFIVAAVTAVLFFVCVLLHELAHALTAKAYRMPVSSITLFLLGGVANLAKEPPSALAEFLMAIAGPATSLALALVGFGLAAAADTTLDLSPALDPVGVVAFQLGVVNLSLAIFNMIPGFPLDGGRVLRAVVWGIAKDRSRATVVAARGGQFVAGLLIVYGVWRMLADGDTFGGLWAAMIAYFLYNAAGAAIAQDRIVALLGTTKVSQIMRSELRTVASSSTVGALVRDVMMPFNVPAVPVVDGTRVVGFVTIADLRRVEQDRWDATLVRDVMRRIEDLVSIGPNETLVVAFERLGQSDLPAIPVLDRGMLVGLLDREAVASYLRMRESLGAR
ncbi:MAG TPA: site-2 protease family protein [Candidatus Limnocylindria bacterium]|nr:site-2 protease family protein [Candidatus Limnocylindria bacterium]